MEMMFIFGSLPPKEIKHLKINKNLLNFVEHKFIWETKLLKSEFQFLQFRAAR